MSKKIADMTFEEYKKVSYTLYNDNVSVFLNDVAQAESLSKMFGTTFKEASERMAWQRFVRTLGQWEDGLL